VTFYAKKYTELKRDIGPVLLFLWLK